MVSQIIVIFEAEDYSEENPLTSLKVMSLMNEVLLSLLPMLEILNHAEQMQEYGAPPAEIMGELPPGMALGQDGLPQLPEECSLM